MTARVRLQWYDTEARYLDVLVEGRPNESVQAELTRLGEEASAGLHTHPVGILSASDPERLEKFSVKLDSTATFQQLAEVFGEDIAASPPVIEARLGIYGGDHPPAEWVLNSLNQVMTIGGYVSAALGIWKLAVKARYTKFRVLAKQWNDSDVISDELTRAVLSRAEWTRGAFDRAFQLSDDRGPRLLRQLGYAQHHEEYRGEIWTEIAWTEDMRNGRR